jgi:hypothetical protein
MGYAKSKMHEQFHIHMKFRIFEELTGTDELVEVTHIMRIPTVAEREEYQRQLARIRGRKVAANTSEANWHLWIKCVVNVEGYDDLPKEGDWKLYFQSGVERVHAEEAASRLLESLESEDTEVEKKFVLSSAQ